MRLNTLLAAAPLLLLAVGGCGSGTGSSRPLESDAELLDRFEADDTLFNFLLDSVVKDAHMIRITPTELVPVGGLPEKRWKGYRELFEKLAIESKGRTIV